MQPLLKRMTTLLAQIDAAFLRLDIACKQESIAQLTEQLANSEVWNNPTDAQAKIKQQSALSNAVDPWVLLRIQVADIIEFIGLGDDSMVPEFEEQATPRPSAPNVQQQPTNRAKRELST